LADQGCAIVGTDVSNEILLLAKALHPNVAFSRPEQIAGSYDVITSMHVLGHVPNPAVTLRSLWTHLAPGGRLVCVVPNPAYTIAMIPSNLLNDYLPDTTVLRLWSKRRLHSALRVAGFSGIDLCTFGEFPALFRIDALRSRLVGVAMRPQELMASA
jgi:2-polyprenyl-3-methyl-5-hydroxy-6-metoxy-1,4-benzoquinol methylase